MKKTIVIIFTVAILGVMGMYINKSPKAAGSQSVTTSAPAANTQSASAPASSTNTNSSTVPGSTYKDGTFTGSSADTAYGTVQVAVVVSGGKITGVNFLQMPNDQGHSREITYYAEPLLKQTTLSKQSANIDFVSGATSTSTGYQESLQAALDKALSA